MEKIKHKTSYELGEFLYRVRTQAKNILTSAVKKMIAQRHALDNDMNKFHGKIYRIIKLSCEAHYYSLHYNIKLNKMLLNVFSVTIQIMSR